MVYSPVSGPALLTFERGETRHAEPLALISGTNLIGYPYGCVEQTMSRVLPNAIVSRAFRDLGIGNQLLEVEVPPMVEVGLQKLYAFQHNDGGWGWWYDDSTDLHQTAYVLFGLSMTEQAGFSVDDSV